MKKNVTIRDVAAAAGVSPSAVTLALNGREGVGQETRARILATAERMGYGRRTPAAAGHSANIHYVIPRYLLNVDRASVPIYHDLLMLSLERNCRKRGYFMAVHYLGQEMEELDAVIRSIKEVEEDPLVIVQAADAGAETVARWTREAPKVVFLNQYFEKHQVDCVASDGMGAVYAATEYLIGRGYRQIGHLKGRAYFKNLADREEGYLRCLTDHGLASAGTWAVHTSYEEAYREVKQYLDEGERFCRALICDGDRQAMGAIRALKERGIRVPEDIAVMGFDDLPMSETHDPPLSTCAISWEEMARLAVQRVIEKTGEAGEHALKISVGAILRPRGTT
jgi:DNA-binding LacI/PurR family transcriptional regulator